VYDSTGFFDTVPGAVGPGTPRLGPRLGPTTTLVQTHGYSNIRGRRN